MFTELDYEAKREELAEFANALVSAVRVTFQLGDNLPTLTPVAEAWHVTDHGEFELDKYLFIMPIGSSEVSLKLVMFAAYDKQENTIYYVPMRPANVVPKEGRDG